MHTANKLSQMVTYLEGLLIMRSFNTLITWSCNVMSQPKTIIYPLPKCLWPPNVAGW